MVKPEQSGEFSSEEVALSLEILGSLNPYMESVVSSYSNVLESHKNGDDLRQFLNELTYYDYEWYRHLNEDQIDLVLTGGSSNERETDYVFRLGFVIGRSNFGFYFNHDLEGPYRSYGQLKPVLDQDSYKERSAKQELLKYASRGGVTLDLEFDNEGRKKDRLDEVHYIMSDFCMQLDQPELATYFAGQVESDPTKISLYFSAMKSGNVSALKVIDLLGELKYSLDPQQLVRFLTLEIKELGLHGGIDIGENTANILILTNDPDLFSAQYRVAVRIKLVEALVAAGQSGLAKRVDKLCGLNQFDKLADEAPQEPKKLDRKGRQQLKAMGKSALRSLGALFDVNINPRIVGDRGRNDRPRDLTATEQAKFTLYMRDFSNVSSWKDTANARLLRYSSADRHFQDVLADQRKSPLTKLIVSAVMALNFSGVPERQLTLEAAVAAELEAITSSIENDVVPADIVTQSIRRQQLRQRSRELQYRINEINNVSLRSKYTLLNKQLLETE